MHFLVFHIYAFVSLTRSLHILFQTSRGGFSNKKRRRIVQSKKIDCPATVVLREAKYINKDDLGEDAKTIVGTLKQSEKVFRKERSDIVIHDTIFMRLGRVHNHSTASVSLCEGCENYYSPWNSIFPFSLQAYAGQGQMLDKRIIQKIEELVVQKKVINRDEMQRHLLPWVKSTFPEAFASNHVAFVPDGQTISTYICRTILRTRFNNIDEASVLEFVSKNSSRLLEFLQMMSE
jgi:hypothetical protein